MPALRVSDSIPAADARRAGAHARAIARGRSRLPLWFFSLIVVAGAVLAMTLTGPRAATTEIPAAVQVGSQAAPSTPSSATSTTPAHATGSTSSTTTTSTAIVPATTPRTRVVQPQETVTREDNSKESDSSSDGSSGAVTSTTSSTLAPASTGS